MNPGTTTSNAWPHATYFFQSTTVGTTNIVGYASAGSLFLNLSSSTNLGAVQLLQTDILPTGQPPTIIVKGGP